MTDHTRKKNDRTVYELGFDKYRSLFENMLEGCAFCRMIFDENDHPEDFVYLEVNPSFDRIIGQRTVTGKRVTEVFPGIKEAYPQLFGIYGRVAVTGNTESFDLYFQPSDKWLHISVYSTKKEFFVAVFEDISERKHTGRVLELTAKLYEISNKTTLLQDLLDQYISEFKRFSDCEAIGIRLLDKEGNIPYQSYSGFPSDFYENESPLSIKSDNCMCIYVIKATITPSLPVATPGGSFYCNATSKFLATISEEEKGKTRNVCNMMGYESVALVPIRTPNGITGLVQFNDHRENKVPLEMIRVIEDVSLVIGETIRTKQAEEAFRESQAKLTTALASMTDAVFISDIDGNFIDFNEAFATFHRFKNKEECAKTLAEYPAIIDVYMASGELAPLDMWAVPRALRGETASNVEYSLRRKDTGETWVGSYSFGPIRDTDGKIIGSVVTSRDITQRKKDEELLRTTLQRLHALVSSMRVSILLVWNGRIELTNQTFCDYFGFSEKPDRLIGFTDADIIQKIGHNFSNPDEQLRRIREITTAGKPVIGEEIVFQDGRSFLRDFIPIFSDRKMTGRLWYHIDITASKRITEALRESEERLRLSQDAANAGTWEWYLPTNANFWSDKVWELYGMDPATHAASFDTWLESIHPEDRKTAANSVREASLNGEPIHTEWRVNLPVDQGERWLMSRGQPIRDSKGKVERYRGIVIDITERKRVEKALTQSESKYRSLYQSMRDAYAAADMKGTIQEQNTAFEEMLGYSSEELRLLTYEDITPEKWHALEDKIIKEQVFTRGYSDIYEKEYRRKDGTIFPVELRTFLIRDDKGTNTGMWAIVRDISSRKAAEIELRENERRLAMAMDLAKLANWEYDVTTRMFHFDDRFYALFGTTPEREGGNYMPDSVYVREFVHPDDVERVTEEIKKTSIITDPHFEAHIEHRIIRRDGEIRFIIAHFTIVLDENGKHIGNRGANQDITDRVMQERALTLANQKLQLMNIVAWHDIQNKVTGLRGYVEISKNLIEDAKIAKILQSEEDILRTIYQQLQYTKEYQEIGVQKPQWIYVPNLIRLVISLKDIQGITIRVEIDDLEIKCDPVIERVFYHLLGFSLERERKTTNIAITCKTVSSGIVLFYEDNGKGIPMDNKKDIFVRDVAKFSRFSMFFIHDILEISGMNITETGDPDKGVRFEIMVPKGIYRLLSPRDKDTNDIFSAL